MNTVVVFLLALSLSACADIQSIRSSIGSKGAEATDQALESAKWYACQATSVGALERDLGGDPERIAGWILWCGKKPQNSPLKGGVTKWTE